MQTNGQNNPATPRTGNPARPQLVIPPVPPEYQSEKYLKMSEPELIAIVKDANSTVFQKNIACRRLALIGTKAAVPALLPLLANEQLAHYACYALKPIPDPSVDDGLRAALPRLKGKLLVGVINTIGNRGDAKAIDPLSKMFADLDPQVALAAVASIGTISGPASAKILQDALGKTRDPVRHAVADACLVCAEGLLQQGDRKGAFAMYDFLTRPEVPKVVRLAAMHATIVSEAPLHKVR